jgi:GST-like protein
MLRSQQPHEGEPAMIDLYTWPTPNGHKIHIMLEECGLPYNVIPIDIGAGDQFKPGVPEDLAQQ